MSSDIWYIEKDLCRCCHSEGTHKKLSESKGDEKVYSEMLKDYLDINLSPAPGWLCAPTYTICEACILRLQDATNFKRQVLSCEEKFDDMCKRNLIKVADNEPEVKVELEDTFFDVFKDDYSTDDDGFELKYDDEDENNTDVDVEESKKGKSKTAKAKPKSKTETKKGKKVGKTRKQEEDGENAEGTKKKKIKSEREPRNTYYTVTHGKYQCNTCQRAFASQPLVSQHYRFVHLKRRPRERKCPYCEAKVPGYLRAYHLEEVHGIPAPSCGVCGKKFRFPCHVLQHQKKVHMGEKTEICKICEKSFFNSLSLRIHMSTHSDERKFKCSTCEKEFRWENNLKDHVKIHTGDKRYVCGVCGKAFVQKSTLKQHAARNHPGLEVA